MSSGEPEYESFDDWYRARVGHLFDASDVEVAEWSRFMGFPVTPMQIVELRAALYAKLKMEGHAD